MLQLLPGHQALGLQDVLGLLGMCLDAVTNEPSLKWTMKSCPTFYQNSYRKILCCCGRGELAIFQTKTRHSNFATAFKFQSPETKVNSFERAIIQLRKMPKNLEHKYQLPLLQVLPWQHASTQCDQVLSESRRKITIPQLFQSLDKFLHYFL